MSFKEFVVNYLSPWYFIVRCVWAFVAVFAYTLAPLILPAFGLGETTVQLATWAITLLFLWIALRPWKVGVSYNDIKNKLDKL